MNQIIKEKTKKQVQKKFINLKEWSDRYENNIYS